MLIFLLYVNVHSDYFINLIVLKAVYRLHVDFPRIIQNLYPMTYNFQAIIARTDNKLQGQLLCLMFRGMIESAFKEIPHSRPTTWRKFTYLHTYLDGARSQPLMEYCLGQCARWWGNLAVTSSATQLMTSRLPWQRSSWCGINYIVIHGVSGVTRVIGAWGGATAIIATIITLPSVAYDPQGRQKIGR